MKHRGRVELWRRFVAPRVGAWIETLNRANGTAFNRSPPAWGRGLKRIRGDNSANPVSRPPRGGVD